MIGSVPVLDGIEALKVMMRGGAVALNTDNGPGTVHYRIFIINEVPTVFMDFVFAGKRVGYHEGIVTFEDFTTCDKKFVEVSE